MATRKTKRVRSARATTPATGARNGKDALQLLRADHREVQSLFDSYEATRTAAKKAELARQICDALRVHAQIEEEIFYPAARDVVRTADLLDEATVEHASAKALIADIEQSSPGDALFDAKVTVLGEYIKHHVKEEQNELFPKLRASRMDLRAVGDRMAARREELLGAA